MKRPVLCINTYGGSLLIGAKAAGHKIVGSYEDVGYGSDLQRLNFPDVDVRATTAEWPMKPDLGGHIVLAHPPCAWASAQNYANGPSKRGVEAAKFQPTQNVLKYALSGGCDALAVESVCNALELGRPVHDAFAKKYGYDIYRLIQNAASFGLPQWRERCWVLFVERGTTMRVAFNPITACVGDILEPTPSETCQKHLELVKRQRKLLLAVKDGGAILNGKRGFGSLGGLLRKKLGGDLQTVSKAHVVYGSFQSQTPRILNPDGFAPTLLHHTWLMVNGRPLSYVEHNRIMGFPDNYKFNRPRRQKEFLSRGVCPPVATWVLKLLQANLDGTTKGQAYTPGSTIDLRLKRAEWMRLRDGR